MASWGCPECGCYDATREGTADVVENGSFTFNGGWSIENQEVRDFDLDGNSFVCDNCGLEFTDAVELCEECDQPLGCCDCEICSWCEELISLCHCPICSRCDEHEEHCRCEPIHPEGHHGVNPMARFTRERATAGVEAIVGLD